MKGDSKKFLGSFVANAMQLKEMNGDAKNGHW